MQRIYFFRRLLQFLSWVNLKSKHITSSLQERSIHQNQTGPIRCLPNRVISTMVIWAGRCTVLRSYTMLHHFPDMPQRMIAGRWTSRDLKSRFSVQSVQMSSTEFHWFHSTHVGNGTRGAAGWRLCSSPSSGQRSRRAPPRPMDSKQRGIKFYTTDSAHSVPWQNLGRSCISPPQKYSIWAVILSIVMHISRPETSW